jgi:hypothetical protein
MAEKPVMEMDEAEYQAYVDAEIRKQMQTRRPDRRQTPAPKRGKTVRR